MTRLPVFLATSLIASVAFGQDIAKTVADCDACHGKDGVSQRSEVPTIAGISLFAHEDYLLTYKDEARPCATVEYIDCDCEDQAGATDMCKISAQLSEAQISAIAGHYAALPFVPARQKFDEAKALAGAKIHAKDCEKCHSNGGANAEDDASILAGQWMAYLAQSFVDYESGKRGQPKNMKQKLEALDDSDIEALLHFYASRQEPAAP